MQLSGKTYAIRSLDTSARESQVSKFTIIQGGLYRDKVMTAELTDSQVE